MEKKTVGIIAILSTTVLCGLPGLAGLCLGSLAIPGSFISDSSVASEDAAIVVGFAIMIMGLSLVFIAIPAGIGLWAWWAQKKEALSMEGILVPDDDF